MDRKPVLIKVSGALLEQEGFFESLAATADRFLDGGACVVHGGGPQVSETCDRLGVAHRHIDGQRVTDEATLDVAVMVLSGLLNKRLAVGLLQQGVDAVGLSGVDGGLLRVVPMSEDLGRVGRIRAVRDELLTELFARRIVPVISPISLGEDGAYNVNADQAAASIAAAIGADRMLLVTAGDGIIVGDGPVPELVAAEAATLIEEGTIHSGMIPKVQAALSALQAGVGRVVIGSFPEIDAGRGSRVMP